MQIQGKTALVTGAGRGIGRAVCRELMRRGAAGVVVLALLADHADSIGGNHRRRKTGAATAEKGLRVAAAGARTRPPFCRPGALGEQAAGRRGDRVA